jgi:hypothetical protein
VTDSSALRTSLRGLGSVVAQAADNNTGTLVPVYINSALVTVNVARGLTVTVGDVVLVNKVGSAWFVVAVLFDAAPADSSNGTAPVTGGPTTGTTVFSPVETRSRRNGAWRTDNTNVYQGEYGGAGNHTGCAFYGTGPRSLAGATVTAASIHVRRVLGGAYAPQTATMRLVTEANRPSGAPTLTSSITGPSLHTETQNDAFAVPTSWAQSMVDGTAGGLGFFVSGGTPYIQFAGIGTWGPAFTLSITWSR